MLSSTLQKHVEMTLFWTKVFRHASKRANSPRWRFDLRTTQLLRAISRNNESDIEWLYKEREQHMFGAVNRREKKFITVQCEVLNFDKSYTYLDIWGPGYENFPSLTFIGQHNQESALEFEALFVEFLKITDDESYTKFKAYLKEQYGCS
jgi:hypothetical protein